MKEITKIYLVWSGEWEDAVVMGIFTTLELAEKFVKENYQQWYTCCSIEDWEIDKNSWNDIATVKAWKINGYIEGEKELQEVK